MASATNSVSKRTPKKGSQHLGGVFQAQAVLPLRPCQLLLAQATIPEKGQLCRLRGHVEKAVGPAVPAGLRLIKQRARLHHCATALLLGRAVGAVRLRRRRDCSLASRLSLGAADARHLLVDALLILRLNVPGPIACSAALRHGQPLTPRKLSKELTASRHCTILLYSARAKILIDNLGTTRRCKALSC